MMPVVRLARIGLFAAATQRPPGPPDAGLLNRNIVLFEPYHAQQPESSGRHRLATFRSELENAERPLLGWLDQGQASGSRRGLADLESGSKSSPRRRSREPNEERSGREIPVEAVVERLIQLTPSG